MVGNTTDIRCSIQNIVYTIRVRISTTTSCKSKGTGTNSSEPFRLSKTNIFVYVRCVDIQISQNPFISCMTIFLLAKGILRSKPSIDIFQKAKDGSTRARTIPS